MATPLGHGIIGLALGQLGGVRHRSNWLWLVFAVFAACAPDLDFLPGLLAGDINLYHQRGSHSILAAVVFGLVVAAAGRGRLARPVYAGVIAGLIYGSHLVLDCMTFDGRAPYGIPLLWPFSSEHFIAPITPFHGVKHGVPGDSLGSVLGDIFSMHNLGVVLTESLWLMPVLAVSVLITLLTRRVQGRPGPGR